MKSDAYKFFYWSIPGWLPLVDFKLIQMIGNFQNMTVIQGPMLEIGCYKGKSSILLGKLLRQNEELVLVDLFEEIGANSVVDTPLYKGLTQKVLQRNLKIFQVNANIYKIDSEKIMESIGKRNFRIIHVDAGHTYGPVSKDLQSALSMIQEAGVIILDDYRNINFPGMWIAFAEFVSNSDISVIFATETKAYFVKTNHLNNYKSLIDEIKDSRKFRILSTPDDPYLTLRFNHTLSVVQKLYSAAGFASVRLSNLLKKIKLYA
jgi:hypothetical protein